MDGDPMHLASLQFTISIGALMTALAAMVLRFRASDKPVTVMKLLMPPLAMSTGFLMFVVPVTRIPLLWGLVTFLIGAMIFSYPLIRFSQLERRGDKVYLIRSKAFMYILGGLLLVRILLRQIIEQYVTLPQTGAIFFILAFGMLLPWRLAMYSRFRKLL